MREIPLTQGKVALVDDEDYERLSLFKWHARKAPRAYVWYAARYHKGRALFMHREILDLSPDMEADHRDGNGLNNQKMNLRPATHSQNQRNQPRLYRNNKSGFRGVYWSNHHQKWRAEISDNGRNVLIGYFNDKVDAAHGYDKAATAIAGDFASLNFPKQRKPAV